MEGKNTKELGSGSWNLGNANRKNKITKFTDLDAWREGHRLVLMIYQLTQRFPKEEQFGLTSQLRRCAVSITSNIAEGFSREGAKEKAHFYNMSKSSITELQNQLIVSRDVQYLTAEEFEKAALQSVTVHKLVNGLIRSTKLRLQKSSPKP